MKVKNISTKIVAIPVMEGGHAALLPNCVAEVDDSFAEAVQTVIDCGFLEVTREKVTPPIAEAENEGEEPKKVTRRTKAAKETADIE